MDADSPVSDQSPVTVLHGRRGSAALQLVYDVTGDDDAWVGMLLRALAEGAVVVIERNGDWVIYPS